MPDEEREGASEDGASAAASGPGAAGAPSGGPAAEAALPPADAEAAPDDPTAPAAPRDPTGAPDAPADPTAPAASPEGGTPSEPAPSPPAPDEPPEAPPGLLGRLRGWARRRSGQTEARWALLFERARRRRVVVKVILLHLRYTCGYLAAGFLVSAPIQLGTQDTLFDDPASLLKSLVLGLIFAVPFLVLHPVTQIDWARMRLPEFKNLELALCRFATYAAAALFGASLVVRAVPPWRQSTWGWLLDVRVSWLALVLMFFAWVRVKSHTVIFKDFYTLNPGDDLVLSYPPPVDPTSQDPRDDREPRA